jgi:hypothetical protein
VLVAPLRKTYKDGVNSDPALLFIPLGATVFPPI